MGAVGRYGFFIVSTLGLFSAIFWTYISQVPPLPEIKPQWWGPGQPQAVDRSIRPFKINISDEVLDDLQDRLELLPTLTPPLEGIGFQYGFNTKYLQEEVIEYWKTKYNWREQEKFLNKFPQFKTCVDGLDIHFIHVKPTSVPEGTEVLPLLLLHGWPGSVREFYEIIPHLVKPQAGYNFVFEVIVPSLPGYGFSDGAAKPGLGAAQIAVIMKNFMERIGQQKFIVQGGDWGAVIASNMATLFPENVKGLHSNACFVQSLKSTIKLFLGSLWPTFVVEKDYVDKVYPLWEHFQFLLEESGYLHLQATKPDTIGVALRDSPAGLAAYILEKFSTWTNPAWKTSSDGGLTKKFSLTKLLDNIMIYWVTGSITTSARLYSETFTKAQMALELDSIPTAVPSGCTNAPNELMYLSESLLHDKYVNLIHFSHMKAGGHFLAFEEPQLLADDIWQFVRKLRTIAKLCMCPECWKQSDISLGQITVVDARRNTVYQEIANLFCGHYVHCNQNVVSVVEMRYLGQSSVCNILKGPWMDTFHSVMYASHDNKVVWRRECCVFNIELAFGMTSRGNDEGAPCDTLVLDMQPALYSLNSGSVLRRLSDNTLRISCSPAGRCHCTHPRHGSTHKVDYWLLHRLRQLHEVEV